ncbi:Pleiotropic drug resistance protein 1 [Vitis vinifera]|uniref:Pleiotropic drug resistance protein 1 n=1 Tax=Vitis vinifera TaxID=29760 RepID=A0A438F1M0_VITVI|nr:Pleiotropic drug resistance protein 1 [Vitis vinifera]
MESSDISRVTSVRITASNILRNSSVEVFSRSSREEDDEEALKWAALEKLPTFLRIQRGILTEEKGQAREIDIKSLGLPERKNLIQRLVKIDGHDNEKFLLKLKERIDRVGLGIPTVEVRFEHLTVDAEAYVGSRALPTIFNFSANILEGFLNYLHILPSRKKPFSILHDVSGIIKPRRTPSSGKTTLLLALAGRLGSDLKVSGRVTYNGHGMDEFVPQRTSAYTSQYDLHAGEMTVRETLDFSARCQGVGGLSDMLAELSRREKAANIKPDPDIDIYMKAAALEGQKTSVVTEYMLKELHLLDTGEILVGPARALFMDEISTGLDSSTAFQIVNSLRQSIHILNGTALISLLQPAPETYNLFDGIILLSDGKIVYQGPCENVLEFFGYMGFKCPERKGVADFLQEVTSRKDQEQYWAHKDEPYSYVTVKEFAEAFQSFHIGQKLGDELAVPFDKTKGHPAALTTKKICMTLFLRTEMSRNTVEDGGIFMGALFFAVLRIMFNGLTELPMTIFQLPVFYKQRDLLFFPSWAYSLPKWILKMPIAFAEVGAWVIMTYYVIGFDPNIERFFKQYLLLLCIHQMASGLLRLMAALGRNIIVASTFGSFALLLVVVLGGFVLSKGNAISVNEFLGNSWRHVPANSTESLGVLVLKARGAFTEPHWYWLGVGALIGYVLLFNFLFTLALSYLNPFGKPQPILSKETLTEKQANRTGELNELSPGGKSSAETGARIQSGSSRSLSARVGSITEADQRRKRGMVLPFEPLSISFDEIRYAVDMPQEMKAQGVTEDRLELLKGVSGSFRPGILTALMGVTGAGKNHSDGCIGWKKTSGYIEGIIKVSGYPQKQETFARVLGYCEQTDIHSPHVTVYESLLYSAWLRLPSEVDSATRKMFIEEVMELVELNSLREALVGLPSENGLSTEQRKRLTIAVELVANPSIIFMDEPTSGLDARAAAIVMRTVRNTVDTGRTVVCTIHQPSIDIFDAFDELLLLKRGGEEIYTGPIGHHSSHLINTKAALGVNFTEEYKNSELYRRNKALIKELSSPPPGSKDLYFSTQYSQSFFTQCLACLWKQHWSYWRNPAYTAVRLFFTTFIALMFGTIFWDSGSKRKRQQDLFNAMGCIERAAGMYSAFPYAFGQSLNSSGIFFFMYFTFLYFTFYGMMAVAITPNQHISGIVSSAFYGLWNLLSGFIIPHTVEDSSVVEMVLLVMSGVLDFVWIACHTIWGHKGEA